MKVIVLYHPNSEQAGLIEDFARDYERFKNKKLELVSLETVQGSDYARLYDVTQYPAFLATSDNGTMQRMWQGSPLPMMDELAYYTQDQDRHDYAKVSGHQPRVIQPQAI